MHNQVITHQLQVSGALLFTHAYAIFGFTGRFVQTLCDLPVAAVIAIFHNARPAAADTFA